MDKADTPKPTPASKPDTKEAWSIQLEDLRLGYGDHVVLDDINTTIPGGGIGMHANAMMTFNLDDLRLYNEWNPAAAIQFTTSAGRLGDDPKCNSIYSLVVVSDEDKITQAWLQGIDVLDYIKDKGTGTDWWFDFPANFVNDLTVTNANSGLIDYEIDFGEEAKYLSLMILATQDGIGADHGAFYAPTLTLLQPSSNGDSVPEPATWCLLLLACGGMWVVRQRR